MSNSNSILSQKSILSSLHQICNPISNWESFWMSNPYCHPKWIPLKLYLYSKVKFQVKSNLTFSLRFSSKSNLISNPLSNIILKFQFEIRCLILISIWNHCLTKAKVKLKLTFARPFLHHFSKNLLRNKSLVDSFVIIFAHQALIIFLCYLNRKD